MRYDGFGACSGVQHVNNEIHWHELDIDRNSEPGFMEYSGGAGVNNEVRYIAVIHAKEAKYM
jgi:hypothetical protein